MQLWPADFRAARHYSNDVSTVFVYHRNSPCITFYTAANFPVCAFVVVRAIECFQKVNMHLFFSQGYRSIINEASIKDSDDVPRCPANEQLAAEQLARRRLAINQRRRAGERRPSLIHTARPIV